MSNQILLEITLPISILAQLAAAVLSIRLIRITGKPLAWALLAAAMVCMTVRRIILLAMLWGGAQEEVSLASERLGLVISLLLLVGMWAAGGIFKKMQADRDKLDLAAQRLQDASVAGRVVLWSWNIATGQREWSNLVDEMLGFPPNGMPRTYLAWETRIHPVDLAGVQDAIRSNFETNASYDVTYRIQRADDTYVWWHEVGHVNRDRDGSPLSLAGSSVDITERMQRTEEYSTIVQTAMDGVLIASARTGRLLDVNESYCTLVGFTRAELLTMRLADLDLSETPGEVAARLQGIVRSGRDRFETRHRSKDGQTVDVAVSIQYLANTNRVCAFVSDITERKRNENAFRTHLAEIERFNQFATEREQRMILLKQQLNQFAQELGRPPPYDSSPDEIIAATPVALADVAALPAPQVPSPEVPLRDLLDLPQIQSLLESFSAMIGLAVTLTDRKGNMLVGANWQTICTQFHRVNERSWARCFESDQAIAAQLQDDTSDLRGQCRNGLQIVAAPILMDGQPAGSLAISQFLLQPPDTAVFRQQAAEFGLDEQAYLAALARVPVISGEKLAPLLNLLTHCATLIAQIARESLRERVQENTVQQTTAVLQHQREAALNLAQDAIESRRLLEASEEALRQSRDMLTHILDSVPQAIFWKDRRSVFLGCNQVFSRGLNLDSPREIAGKTDYDLVPSREAVEGYQADDREVMETKRAKYHITECVQLPDSLIWVDTNKLPLLDKDGQVYGVLVVYDDITEKRQAEEQVRQQNERHRFALETLGAGEWELDLTTFTARPSEQYARIFGYTSLLEPWPFEKFLGHVVAEDRLRVETTVREGVRLGHDLDFECQIARLDGVVRWVWIRGRHIWNEKEHPLRLAGIVLDITDRKHEEALVRQSKEHLQLALVAIEDAIWDWVPTANRLYWSPRLFTMLGYVPDEFTPSIELWEKLLHPEDLPLARSLMQQCVDGQRDDCRFEARFRTRSDSWFWVQVRGRVLARGLDGEILRMAGAHVDISEGKQHELVIHKQLEELQRWQAVMLGREQRAMELKREINVLLRRVHEPVRYPSAEEGPGGPDALAATGSTAHE